MTTLLLVGLLSGLVTALSPCVLPVLPVVLTTSAARPSSRARPFAVVGGLVLSFGAATLVGGAALRALGLPQDLLRWLGIATLALVGLALLWPRLGDLLEAPFRRIRGPRPDRDGNGFVLGLGMGLVFVPCAGPILASISVLAATERLGPGLVALTAAYCVGVAIPLLAVALAGTRLARRSRAIRERARVVRTVAGAVLVATALAVTANVVEPLQRLTPDWFDSVSTRLASDAGVRGELDRLAGREPPAATSARGEGPLPFYQCAVHPDELQDCGPAPELTGITGWLNSEPLTIAGLRGHVVLVDFWTYSCINCQRTLPYVTRWARDYADDGLVVIGVHSPEFAFEHVASNVADNAARLGVTYPVALDDDLATWQAFDQRFWPTHYLIDADGTVRQVRYGEGGYAETEASIRTLLGLDPAGGARDDAPSPTEGQSPETYLGADRVARLVNPTVATDRAASYALQTPALHQFSLGGTWTVRHEYAEAGPDAALAFRFHAAQVYLVLAGEGTVSVAVDGVPEATREVTVSGTPTLYTLYDGAARTGTLRLGLSPGLQAYAFTFG